MHQGDIILMDDSLQVLCSGQGTCSCNSSGIGSCSCYSGYTGNYCKDRVSFDNICCFMEERGGGGGGGRIMFLHFQNGYKWLAMSNILLALFF